MLCREEADHGYEDGTEENQIAGEVRQLRRQLDAEVIDQCLGAGDDDQKDHLVGQRPVDVERRAEGTDEECPGADIDGPQHGDETKQVEPCRDPAGAAIAEDRAPVVEASGRRIGRTDLRHGHREGERDEAADQPADADADATGARGSLSQRVDAAGQDADDRERDGEIRKAAQAPLQFLGVAHVVEDFYVLRLVCIRVVLWRHVEVPYWFLSWPIELTFRLHATWNAPSPRPAPGL